MRSMSAVESHEQRLRPTMPAVTAGEQPRSGHANETSGTSPLPNMTTEADPGSLLA